MSFREGQAFADKHGMGFIEISVKSGVNIEKLVTDIVTQTSDLVLSGFY